MLSAIVLTILAASSAVQYLDFAHTPEWLTSSAKPETQLLGISVGSDSLAEVEKRFGMPSEIRKDSEDSESATYMWKLPGLELSVTAIFPAAHPSKQLVMSVRVRGDSAARSAKTRAGIRLGDSFEKLIATYGKRYRTGALAELGEGLTVIFTFENETELAACLDSDTGKIVALQLTVSEE